MIGLGDDPETAEAKRRMSVDAADPRRRFVFALLAISYELDPAYLPEHATTAIREWYGISGRDDLRARIHDYSSGDVSGYDIFRGVFLARAGQGAGLLSEQESWGLAFHVARRVQAVYGSFSDYGGAYLAGHLAYRQSQGDDPTTLAERQRSISTTIAELSRGLWSQTPYTVAC